MLPGERAIPVAPTGKEHREAANNIAATAMILYHITFMFVAPELSAF